MVEKMSEEGAESLNEEYIGIVENYRRGPKSQRNRECLVKTLDIESNGPSLIGWKVGWPHDEPRLFGTIVKPHGTTGTLRVKFRKGLPGQALGTIVKIVREWSM